MPAENIHLNPDKTDLIDYVYRRCQPTPRSFADLGGIRGVDGAYTWCILQQYGAERGYRVDTNFTEGATKEAQAHRNVQLLEGNFGEKSVADRLASMDGVLLFDIFLHQVKPDWNEVLEMYSKGTEYFLIFNQQWTASDHTVRRLDLGRDDYFRNIPHGPQLPIYKALFEHIDEIHPQHKRSGATFIMSGSGGLAITTCSRPCTGSATKCSITGTTGEWDPSPISRTTPSCSRSSGDGRRS